jgi:tetratricopeptide (TPR) repeat protein
VDASSAESLERGYLQMANIYGLEARVAVVQRWLSNVFEPWALILDNADDPRLDLSPYFPVGNRGVILITSRNPACTVHSTVGSYELGAMNPDEAVTLMLKTAGIHDLSSRSMREGARPVVLTLGCLALAITQAGAVIRQGRCRMEEYCPLYARRRKELLSQKAIQGGEDYRYTVYTTWEISRQMIEKMASEVGQDALELLQTFSFLHHEGISEEIFLRGWHALRKDRQSDWMLSHLPKMVLRPSDQELNVDTLRAAVSVLLSFSLVYRDKDNLMSMHPLVHTWVRDRLGPSDEETIWMQTTSVIALSVPWTFQTADYRFRQGLIPHIDTCLGFRNEGIFSLEDVGEECQRMASSFALVYSEAGRLQKALQLTERVVEANKRTLGEEHPDTLGSMHNLAIRYSDAGERQKALQLTERVVKAYTRTLGEEHPDTLRSKHALANGYSEVGERQKALQLTERVVKARKRMLGEEHPDTFRSKHALAIWYSEAGERQKALQLMKRVVEAYKRTLGEEHIITVRSVYRG